MKSQEEIDKCVADLEKAKKIVIRFGYERSKLDRAHSNAIIAEYVAHEALRVALMPDESLESLSESGHV